MTWSQITDSFFAFNSNAASSIAYAFSVNWWLFLLVIGALATTIMSVMSKTQNIVREEQNVI
jgi:hypothetical protein